MPDPVTVAAPLRPLLGRRLLAVTEARHWFDDKPATGTDGLLHFWLHFEGAPAIMAHGCGELLKLTEEDPYSSYDMQEYGRTAVGPVQLTDLLGEVIGQHLVDVGLLQGYSTIPAVGGLLLRFDRTELLVATLADEWVCQPGPIPDELRQYLSLIGWLNSSAPTAEGQ
ncbi:hypothetical protein OG989_10275 [Micromonospora sp. NBC_01740]|uniref:hypothetical protein n=1 Tax=unclassified Micromonospora TaxID=2617518 RepID=UPI001CED164C|nr:MULTISPECIES: hypothetical protein [unclassified Micromonospora]WSG04050.1 hypothetical protein OG989_10275 [Micromonospora sp. NBC_01740]